jgi:hypothetical protein
MGDGSVTTEKTMLAASTSVNDLRRRWNVYCMSAESKGDADISNMPKFDLSRYSENFKLFYDDSYGGKYILSCSYKISIKEIKQHI